MNWSNVVCVCVFGGLLGVHGQLRDAVRFLSNFEAARYLLDWTVYTNYIL